MIYEIINPSDPVTINAESFESALLATALLGSGQYAAHPIDDSWEKVPLFLFGGFDKWFAKRFPRLGDASDLLDLHKADTVAALRSTLTGTPDARRQYNMAAKHITDPDELKAFRRSWEAKKRTSLNDIADRAQVLADKLEKSK